MDSFKIDISEKYRRAILVDNHTECTVYHNRDYPNEISLHLYDYDEGDRVNLTLSPHQCTLLIEQLVMCLKRSQED